MLDLTDVTGPHLASRLDFFLHAFFWQSCGNILVVSGAMAHLLRDLQWAHPVIFKSMFEQKKVIPQFFENLFPANVLSILRERSITVADMDQCWYGMTCSGWQLKPYGEMKKMPICTQTTVTPADQNGQFVTKDYNWPDEASMGETLVLFGGRNNKSKKTSQMDGLVQFINCCRDLMISSNGSTSSSSASVCGFNAIVSVKAPPPKVAQPIVSAKEMDALRSKGYKPTSTNVIQAIEDEKGADRKVEGKPTSKGNTTRSTLKKFFTPLVL